MILFKSLLSGNVLFTRSSIIVFFIKLILVLCSVKICLSFPMESFVYETNPVQKLSFQYNQDGSTRPIRFKLQAISFKINEQLRYHSPTLDVYQDSMQDSAENAFRITNKTKMNKIDELRESEKKFHPLSRFTVFYNTSDRDLVNNNVAHNDLKRVDSTTEDQTETEGSHADNNTNTKDSKTADREKNMIDTNSVTRPNLDDEDETTESEPELSVNKTEIQINKINKNEKIHSFPGTMKNEYQIITVQDVTEPIITTETILEAGDDPSESYENIGNKTDVVNPKENYESDYASKYEINTEKNIGRHQVTESITIEDLQTDIYDNITTEGYTRTGEYEESDNTTESENRTTNSIK